jgi:hypothetical protein
MSLEDAIDERGLGAVSASLGEPRRLVVSWALGGGAPSWQSKVKIFDTLGIAPRKWDYDAVGPAEDSTGARKLRALVGLLGADAVSHRIYTSADNVRAWACGERTPTMGMRGVMASEYGIHVDSWPGRKRAAAARNRLREDRSELLSRIGEAVLYDADGPGESIVVRRGVLIAVEDVMQRTTYRIDDEVANAVVRLPCFDVRRLAVSRIRPRSGRPSQAAIAWVRQCRECVVRYEVAKEDR